MQTKIRAADVLLILDVAHSMTAEDNAIAIAGGTPRINYISASAREAMRGHSRAERFADPDWVNNWREQVMFLQSLED